jgi:Site-specific recombinases, DNA invertase Pin homologs
MLAILTRISRDNDDKVSIETQLQQGVKLAEELGLQYKQYEERVVSSYAPLNERPVLVQMVKDIEDGIITAVFVYDQTRLERSVETRSILLRKFEKYKVKTYYDSGFVSSTSENKLVGNILSALGEYTIELTSAKIKLAINYNAEKGKVHALPPYAYYKDENKKYAINEEQAEIIKEIYALSLSGVGTNKIAEILNQRGVLTKYNLIGKGTLKTINKKHKLKREVIKNKADIKWTGNSVRGILYNKFYYGVRLFNGVEYEVPALFSKHYWQKVNDNLKKNSNNSGKNTEHKYLLKGVITCGRCGRNYYGRTRLNKRDNYYMCSSKRINIENCGNRSLNIDVLDEIIWSKFIGDGKLSILIENHFKSINTTDIVDDISKEIKEIESKLKVLDKEKANIINSIKKGELLEIDVKSEMNSIRIEKDVLDVKLYNLKEQLNSYKDEDNNIDSILKELNFNVNNVSFNDKKAILNKYIKDIKIYYDDLENYYIEIFFNVLNMDSIVYTMKNNYKYTYPVIDLDSKDEQQMLLIILDEKLAENYKNRLEVNINLMMNSKQMFEELKLNYKFNK